jgi:hypothetical protein
MPRSNPRRLSTPLSLESLESRAVPAVVLSPASVTVPEGQARQVSFKLTKAPTADVSFTLQSSNPAEATIDKTSLTFTPVNWRTPQAVTITAVEDLAKDGNKSLTIVTAAAVSSDAKYATAAVKDVKVKVLDSKRLAPIDPSRYQGAYAGTFSGRGTFGTISATVSGRTAFLEMTVSAPAAGLKDTLAVATGSIADDGSINVTAGGPIVGATYKGKVSFGPSGEVSFQGTWKYKSLASGNWRVDRIAAPTNPGIPL